MNFKKSLSSIHDKNARNLDDTKDFPTIADLTREQKVSLKKTNSVHHIRDLDSLG